MKTHYRFYLFAPLLLIFSIVGVQYSSNAVHKTFFTSKAAATSVQTSPSDKHTAVLSMLREEEWQQAGKLLFHATQISSDNGLACSSCHLLDNYFQDGYERAFARGKLLRRNTPTLLNVKLYEEYFWDGRAESLYEQIKGPLFSLTELNSDPELLKQFIDDTPELKKIATPVTAQSLPVEEFVILALEQYVNSLATKETKYTLYLQEKARFTEQELNGLKLFMGKAGCAQCHSGSSFTDQNYHDNGLYKRKIILETYQVDGINQLRLGKDYGRGDIVSGQDNLYTFRTPSLWNVELTAPYMHDGSLPTLEAVVDFYNRGGDDKTVSRKGLELSAAEKEDIISFLRTLTDTRFSNDF
jgi:cytochrome c peroxidase